jgi:hypothetical protein
MTNTNGSATATVETLAAEVRTLMVGSRQVTMSVAKQLDVVDLGLLDIFGRINLSGEAGIWVIGAHKETSALVKARARYSVKRAAWIWLGDQPSELQRPQRCPRNHKPSRHYEDGDYYSAIDLQFDGWRIEMRPEDTELLHQEFDREKGGRIECTDSCNHWYPRDCRQIIADALDEHRLRYNADQKLYEAAISAPLIVLAGLR